MLRCRRGGCLVACNVRSRRWRYKGRERWDQGGTNPCGGRRVRACVAANACHCTGRSRSAVHPTRFRLRPLRTRQRIPSGPTRRWGWRDGARRRRLRAVRAARVARRRWYRCCTFRPRRLCRSIRASPACRSRRRPASLSTGGASTRGRMTRRTRSTRSTRIIRATASIIPTTRTLATTVAPTAASADATSASVGAGFALPP